MDRIKIDFLRAKYDLTTPKERGVFLFTRIFLVLIIVASVTGLAFSYQTTKGDDASTIGFFTSLARLVGSGDKLLNGEGDDRINFLLLGVGGAGHEGAQLADTIIFSSFRPSTKEVGMLSIPRDLLVPIPGYDGWRKVNSVNAYGESAEVGQGPVLASKVIGGVLNQDIQYYLKIDFGGFATFIDELGGVNVYVDNTFTDSHYPILGSEDSTCGGTTTITTAEDGTETNVPNYSCRFEVLHFEKGWTQMDGKTALKFARSRKGDNGEGSDFARAARQQKIMLAVKSKLLSGATLLNPIRISNLFATIKDSIVTNLSPWELIRIASFLPDIKDNTITHHVLNDPSLVSEAYLNGAYTLVPANDDWHPVQALAANIFSPDSSNIAIDAPANKVQQTASIEIQNGTTVAGLAFRASQYLQSKGFEVDAVSNAQTRDYKHTVIYDLTNGQKPTELNTLKTMLAADVSMSAAGWVFTNEIVPTDLSVSSDSAKESASSQNVDFLIVLGENTANLVMR